MIRGLRFANTVGAPKVPHGTSGTNSPQGMRYRITAAPVLGIEIANGVPKIGHSARPDHYRDTRLVPLPLEL
jgi:hypothetical protein